MRRGKKIARWCAPGNSSTQDNPTHACLKRMQFTSRRMYCTRSFCTEITMHTPDHTKDASASSHAANRYVQHNPSNHPKPRHTNLPQEPRKLK
jgi:hypothetical protein